MDKINIDKIKKHAYVTSFTRYRGEFNWHGEIHTLYTYANSHDQARRFLLTQLAKKLKRTYGSLSSYYGDNEKGNIYITIDPIKKNAYSTTKSLPSLQNIKQELLHLKTKGYDIEQLKFYLKKVYHLTEPTTKKILKTLTLRVNPDPKQNKGYWDNIKYDIIQVLNKGYNTIDIIHFIHEKYGLKRNHIINLLSSIKKRLKKYTNPVKWFVGITKDTIKTVIFFDKENINKTKYAKVFSHIFGSFSTKVKAQTFADLLL